MLMDPAEETEGVAGEVGEVLEALVAGRNNEGFPQNLKRKI